LGGQLLCYNGRGTLDEQATEGCIVPPIKDIHDLTREQLIDFVTDLSKRWLALDGLWFQSVEKMYGLEKAIEADTATWGKFTILEAQRIMQFLGLTANGGLDALELALQFRLYAFINKQELLRQADNILVFRMHDCRVQSARKRKEMPLFPCKSAGLVEYSGFASTIDQRINTRCICCPPDEPEPGCYCAWEFTVNE